MHVHIYTSKIDYEFDLYDKVTLVSNESWLDEDVLIEMISDSYNEPKAVHNESDRRCDWDFRRDIAFEHRMNSKYDEIIFIDEFDEHYDYEEFLKDIEGYNHYFVLFTRDVPGEKRKMVVDEERTTESKIYITLA